MTQEDTLEQLRELMPKIGEALYGTQWRKQLAATLGISRLNEACGLARQRIERATKMLAGC